MFQKKFQFLNGAIGVDATLAAIEAIKKFQFLNGAIGVTTLKALLFYRSYFNSLMVRLEYLKSHEKITGDFLISIP